MIYLDNAATSYPKPYDVAKAVYRAIADCGANAGRGGHAMSREAMDIVWSCREETAALLGITQRPERLCFTQNATEGLNIVIRGMELGGRHVITTPLEHNSVARPLFDVGAQVTYLPLLPTGEADMEQLEGMLRSDTGLVVVNHASNVSGVINDVQKAAEVCAAHSVPLLIDGAQTAGVVETNVQKLGAIFAFSGHKGLLGPQGTGAVYIPEGIDLKPIKSGGTGSNSESFSQPDFLPDRFESGTMNVPALAGLLEGVRFIRRTGQQHILGHERLLCKQLIDGLMNIKGVKVLCADNKNRTGTVSFTVEGQDTSSVASLLDGTYDIAARAGLHCAPLAHRAYGTFETGTVRLSPGWHSSVLDIERALFAVYRIAQAL